MRFLKALRKRPRPEVLAPAQIHEPVLELTLADLHRPERVERASRDTNVDLRTLYAEIGHVAEYVGRLRRDIATLRPHEMATGTVQTAHDEIAGVQAATKAATDAILSAAEAIMTLDEPSPEAFRTAVREKVVDILEACSFQDLTGQRLDRAADMLRSLQERLQRFNEAVAIADASDAFDRRAIINRARRDILMIDGPRPAEAIAQGDVDRMFA